MKEKAATLFSIILLMTITFIFLNTSSNTTAAVSGNTASVSSSTLLAQFGTCVPNGTDTVGTERVAFCFDVCLQDEARPGNVLLFNSTTGDYVFCCGNTTVSGRGTIIKQAGTITLQHVAPDRRVMGKFSSATKNGNASVQVPAGTVLCTISDKDVRNNTCSCGVTPG